MAYLGYTYSRRVTTMEYKVVLAWDDEAYVWMATSPDIPGLALESGSLDALMERVKFAVPDLLEYYRIRKQE